MKKMLSLFAMILIALNFIAFPKNATADENKTFIMPIDHDVMWGGKAVYKAKKGDVMEILSAKPCRSDKSKECWVVKHPEHSEQGVVRKEWIEQ